MLIKIPDREIIFCSKFAVKTATVAYADIGSLMSLHTLFDKYLEHMLCEIWRKLYGPNYPKFWTFWQQTGFFKTIFDTELTLFWKTFL